MSVSNSTNDDNSGLHDLKALASSTKQRRSQRLSSQMEAQDSLLQSAAGLEAVALPDPDKEQPISLAALAIADAPLATAALAHESVSESLPAASIGTPPASGSKILLVVGLAVLAAGAVAFYMMRGGGGDSNSSDKVTAANAVVVPALTDEPAEQAPVVEELAAVADEIADEAATEDELSADDAIEDTADESGSATDSAPEVEASAAKNSKTTDDKAPKTDKSEEAIARAEAKATAKEEAKAAREQAKADKLAAKAEKKAAASDEKAPTLGEGGASLDDVLSSVTGGVDKPIVDKKKDDTPSKKDLDRGDVAKAMKAITPAAKSCYAAEEFSGTVMVKYSVAPSGAMTKVSAMGAHKNSKTGKCVLSAVKKASFPAFSGATQSFTFPFLLSP